MKAETVDYHTTSWTESCLDGSIVDLQNTM